MGNLNTSRRATNAPRGEGVGSTNVSRREGRRQTYRDGRGEATNVLRRKGGITIVDAGSTLQCSEIFQPARYITVISAKRIISIR